MNSHFATGTRTVLASPLVTAGAAQAQVPSVCEPAGTNLGGTSFYDGFSGARGWAGLSYPFFVQRFELDAIASTGHYKRSVGINASTGFASLTPYWAATLMPAEGWEISWRLHYLYNFKNNKPAASNPVPYAGDAVTNTQAGQAAWIDLTTSYSVNRDVSLGINAYYFQQLTDSKAYGVAIPNVPERVLGVGPGLMWRIADDKSLWVNTYTDTQVRNRESAPPTLPVRTTINF